jgi:hypothetical protein
MARCGRGRGVANACSRGGSGCGSGGSSGGGGRHAKSSRRRHCAWLCMSVGLLYHLAVRTYDGRVRVSESNRHWHLPRQRHISDKSFCSKIFSLSVTHHLIKVLEFAKYSPPNFGVSEGGNATAGTRAPLHREGQHRATLMSP